MLPSRLTRDTRVRAVLLWVGLRTLLFSGFAFVSAFDAFGALDLPVRDGVVGLLVLLSGLWTFLWTVGLTGALVLIDMRVTGHEVEDLLAIGDEVIWMVAGTTHVLGTPAEAHAHHQFRNEYLGPKRGVA